MFFFDAVCTFTGKLDIAGCAREWSADIMGQIRDILFQLFFGLFISVVTCVLFLQHPVQPPAECQEGLPAAVHRQLYMAAPLYLPELFMEIADICPKTQTGQGKPDTYNP